MEPNRLSVPRHLSQVDSYRFFCFKPLSLVTQNTIFTRCDKFQMLCFLSEDNRVRSEARGPCVSQAPKHVAVCVFQPNLHDIRLTHMEDSYCVLAFIQCAPADCLYWLLWWSEWFTYIKKAWHCYKSCGTLLLPVQGKTLRHFSELFLSCSWDMPASEREG